MTSLEIACAAAAALGLAAAATFAALRKRAQAEAASLAKELEAERAAPRLNEYRLERFGLLWFPCVAFQEREKLLVRASPGVPYCKACVKPLAAREGGWSCPGCSEQRPDSVADPAATDSVVREAVAYFLQRHPDFKLAPELESFRPR